MAKVRVPVIGTVGKAIRINPDATEGSQIGTDLQLPNGAVPSLAELARALYIASPPSGTLVIRIEQEGAGGPSGPIFESAIVDGTILARVADPETISGSWNFTSAPTFSNVAGPVISNINPQLRFFESDAPADEKYWRFLANGSAFSLDAVNDAFSAPVTVFTVSRTGTNIGSVDFLDDVDVAGALTALTFAGILGGNLTNAGAAQLIVGEWNFTGATDFFAPVRIGNAGQTDWGAFRHTGADFILDFTQTADFELGDGLTGVILLKAALAMEDAITGNTFTFTMLSNGYLNIVSTSGTPVGVQWHGNFFTRFFSPDDTNFLQIQVTNSGGAFFTGTGVTSFIFDNYIFDTDQTVGAGQDNFVLTYDDGDGQISLEASNGVVAGTTNDAMLRWSGSAWVEVTAMKVTSAGALTALTYGGILESNLTNAGLDGQLIVGDWNFTGDQDFWAPVRIGNAGQTDYITLLHNGADFIADFVQTADFELGAGLTGVILLKAALAMEDAITGNTFTFTMLSNGYLDIVSASGTPVGVQWHGNFFTRFYSPDDTNFLQIQVTDGGGAFFTGTGVTAFTFDNYEFDTDQTVGAGQDNFVLTYDDADGQISLEVATGGGGISDGTQTNAMLRWSGSAWVEVTAMKVTSAGALTALTFAGILGANLANIGSAQLVTGAWNFTNTGGIDFFGPVRIGNAGQTDWVTMSHNGVDLNWVGFQTTDWNISGITALNAGSMDADFDVLTATSFGGITSANLVGLADTTPTLGFLYTARSAANVAFYVRQGGSGPIVRFFKNASTAATSPAVAADVFEIGNTGVPTKGGKGVPYWTTSGQNSAVMTISTSAASGGANGDIHFRYV